MSTNNEAHILDGQKYAKEIEQDVASFLAAKSITDIALHVILVGHHAASHLYVNRKKKACERVGMQAVVHEFTDDVSETQLLQLITKLNQNKAVTGILVQLPLPKHIHKEKIQQAIDPQKDVDGFHIENIGKLVSNIETGLFPCTPQGCLYLIKQVMPDIRGKRALVIGRSLVVGMPMFHTLVNENATVTIAHIDTKNLSVLCKDAEIIVSATGVPGLVKGSDVSKGAIVIDVGIHRLVDSTEGTRIVGDVCFDDVRQKALAISPVPGGVGPMTIAFLLKNCLKAYMLQRS
ncbi:MAG: bifunctional 5,10-methylenetetrahydrofolate dehydrogenase/5,10-methenyltetrahydrofolate cyclohydrolase [Alphaproteobacteria bacterium]|jgi:methylenetetrahydrofolate dehydrogenase (NADP+)/methenyltetrahydrofolate cyclohydrolase|nr:bifunctional 5,10-methylenetetrahydrofolate dehydrogenase/5,10-methenyltetrahydrofolate cyclohydrolase [Alphaproteobacteria bacterium]MBP9877332.1 bifunctional 5,10-methylenetetrahydrofolate dehydrogenase/5,10-methenyltetrahydrofolate cyclohydrolase [Alphaproteobacteria bacterium]